MRADPGTADNRSGGQCVTAADRDRQARQVDAAGRRFPGSTVRGFASM
jgi:hypothetical protein